MTLHIAQAADREWYADVSVNTAVGTTDEVAIGDFTMGSFRVPTGSSITTITWYSNVAAGGTGLPANDELSAPVTQTVSAGNEYALPAALAGMRSILPVGDAAGTINILLKRAA